MASHIPTGAYAASAGASSVTGGVSIAASPAAWAAWAQSQPMARYTVVPGGYYVPASLDLASEMARLSIAASAPAFVPSAAATAPFPGSAEMSTATHVAPALMPAAAYGHHEMPPSMIGGGAMSPTGGMAWAPSGVPSPGARHAGHAMHYRGHMPEPAAYPGTGAPIGGAGYRSWPGAAMMPATSGHEWWMMQGGAHSAAGPYDPAGPEMWAGTATAMTTATVTSFASPAGSGRGRAFSHGDATSISSVGGASVGIALGSVGVAPGGEWAAPPHVMYPAAYAGHGRPPAADIASAHHWRYAYDEAGHAHPMSIGPAGDAAGGLGSGGYPRWDARSDVMHYGGGPRPAAPRGMPPAPPHHGGSIGGGMHTAAHAGTTYAAGGHPAMAMMRSHVGAPGFGPGHGPGPSPAYLPSPSAAPPHGAMAYVEASPPSGHFPPADDRVLFAGAGGFAAAAGALPLEYGLAPGGSSGHPAASMAARGSRRYEDHDDYAGELMPPSAPSRWPVRTGGSVVTMADARAHAHAATSSPTLDDMMAFRMRQWQLLRALLLRRFTALTGNVENMTMTPSNLHQALQHFHMPRTPGELVSRPHKYQSAQSGSGGGGYGGGGGRGMPYRYRGGSGGGGRGGFRGAMQTPMEAALATVDAADLLAPSSVPVFTDDITAVDSLALPPVALGHNPWAHALRAATSGHTAAAPTVAGSGAEYAPPPTAHAASPTRASVAEAAPELPSGSGHGVVTSFGHIAYAADPFDGSTSTVLAASPASATAAVPVPASATVSAALAALAPDAVPAAALRHGEVDDASVGYALSAGAADHVFGIPTGLTVQTPVGVFASEGGHLSPHESRVSAGIDSPVPLGGAATTLPAVAAAVAARALAGSKGSKSGSEASAGPIRIGVAAVGVGSASAADAESPSATLPAGLMVEESRAFLGTTIALASMAAVAAGLVSSRRYKTKLCHAFQQGYCPRGDRCDYAHGEGELRVQHDTSDGKYKSKICRVWLDSCGTYCPFANKCSYAHGAAELRHPAFAAASPSGDVSPASDASTMMGTVGASTLAHKPFLCRTWLRGAVLVLANSAMTGSPPEWRVSAGAGRAGGSSALGCTRGSHCPYAHGLDDLRLPPASMMSSCLHAIAGDGLAPPTNPLLLAHAADCLGEGELYALLVAATLMVPVLPPSLLSRVRARHSVLLQNGSVFDDFDDMAPRLRLAMLLASSSTLLPISMSATQHVEASSSLDVTRIIAIVGAEACNAAAAVAAVQLGGAAYALGELGAASLTVGTAVDHLAADALAGVPAISGGSGDWAAAGGDGAVDASAGLSAWFGADPAAGLPPPGYGGGGFDGY